jgi:UDP-glucuronate decarboxylase
MKRLLITGAYGLVGSNICKVLERDYPEIEITKVKCDEVIVENNFDYLVYGAGYGQPQMFGKDKLRTIEINTNSLSYFIKKIKLGGKVLFISSSEIYSGTPSPHTELSIGTTTPQHPRACYIEGKRCGEAICMAYREQGYDVKIARLALAYGPGTKKGDTRALNQLIEKALTTGVISMIDAGTAMRTYLYVDDCAEMMLDILFKGTQPVYNVGGISKVSIYELAQKIGALTGVKVINGKDGLKGAPDDVELSLGLVLTEFPRTFVSLDEGLKRTINYQKQLYV